MVTRDEDDQIDSFFTMNLQENRFHESLRKTRLNAFKTHPNSSDHRRSPRSGPSIQTATPSCSHTPKSSLPSSSSSSPPTRITRSTSSSRTNNPSSPSQTSLERETIQNNPIPIWHTIPRRPKETRSQIRPPAHSKQPSRSNLTPQTSSTPSRTTITAHSSPKDGISTPTKSKFPRRDSLSPLPSPLKFSPISNNHLTRRNTPPSRVSTPTRPQSHPKLSFKHSLLKSKPHSKLNSPFKDSLDSCDVRGIILAPDSTDSPGKSNDHPAYLHARDDLLNLFESISDPECDHDQVPKKLFSPYHHSHRQSEQPIPSSSSSSRPASKFFTSHSKPINQDQHHIIDSNESRENGKLTDPEVDKRQQLLADLGFDDDIGISKPSTSEPLSSSPIEIVQPSTNTRGKTREQPTPAPGLITPTPAREPTRDDVTSDAQGFDEREDERTFQTIELTSSIEVNSFHQSQNLSQKDQIRQIGVVIDDDDCSDSGIAPLMNSWPASKRNIFLKMAGLKAQRGRQEEEAEPTSSGEDRNDFDEWDQLLVKPNKSRKTANSSKAKFGFKKAFHNRPGRAPWFARSRKKGSKGSKSIGKTSARRSAK